MRLLCGTLVAFGCLFVSSLGLDLFPENHQFIYHYKGHLRTGVTKPSHFGNFWEFEGHLHVEGGPDGLALFKLVDVHLGKYNGEITKEEFHSPDPLVPVKDWVTEHLASPWVARYRDGIVTEVDLGQNTDKRIDIDNIKRSIVSSMQIDLLNLNDRTVNVWDSKEENSFGSCLTSYTSMKTSPDEIQIKKFIDHAKCKNPKLKLDYGSSLPIDTCLQQKDNLEKSSNTQRKYILTHPKDNLNKLKLIRMESSTANLFLPFRHYGNAKYSYSTQKLKLESSTDSIATKTAFTPGKQTILHFHIMKKVFFIKERALEVLDSIIKETSADEQKVEEENVSQHIYILKRLLKTATKEQILDFIKEASNKGESHKNFLINSFGLINTKSALEVYIELFKENKIVKPILNVVQTIEYPTEKLLDLFSEDMMDDPEIVSAFSILVGRICEKSCNPETIAKWDTYFMKKFQETESKEKKIQYLWALKNIASPNLLELLTPIIRDHSDTNIRFYAMEAIKHLRHSKHMYELSWPIFINRTEPVELRYTAMKYLIISRQTASNLLQIHWHLDAEKDGQIYALFSEMIDELSEAHHPCLQTVKVAAHYIKKFVNKEPKSNWGVNWIRSDFIDEEIGLVKSSGFVSMRTSDSYLPDLYHWYTHESALGHTMIADEIIIKGESLFHLIDPLFEGENYSTMKSVLEALERIDFKLKENRPFYMDIIVKRFERVVQYIHLSTKDINKTEFLKKLFEARNIYGTHYIDWQWHIDNRALSDLGTIVKNQIDLFKFHSVGYEKSTKQVEPILQIDTLFKYRYSQYKFDTIKSLNPFEEQVHMVSNSLEDKFHIKLNTSTIITRDPLKEETTFETTLFNKKGDSIWYNTESATTSMIIDIRTPNNNNTISFRKVPAAPKTEIEYFNQNVFDIDHYGVDFSISGHQINFFDSEIFEQIINSLFTESRFLGYVGSIFNIVPYLNSHRTLVNLADDLNLNFKAESLKDSEIVLKICIPERVEDSHYESEFIYRLVPENEEMLKMKTHGIIKNELVELSNIFYTELIGFEIFTDLKYYDNMVDPYKLVLNMSKTVEGKNQEMYSFELTDSWNVKEIEEFWPIESCLNLMNPDVRTAYSIACDKAWENQSYNTTLKSKTGSKESEIIIETTDDDRIIVHSKNMKLSETVNDLITDISEIFQSKDMSQFGAECIANIYNVITWDGFQVNRTYPKAPPLVDCYHLLVSDTNQMPQYAVWVKGMDPGGSLLISLKIFSLSHLIEVIPKGPGEFEIVDLSDGEKKVNMDVDKIYPGLEIKKVHERLVIYLDDLTLVTNGGYVHILADDSTWHQVGGLCGSFDDDANNDIQTNTFEDCKL